MDAARSGLSTSLFERLQACGLPPLLLNTQYRMHPEIAAWPSKQFYSRRLQSAVTPEQRPSPRGLAWPSADVPIAFVRVVGSELRRATDVTIPGTRGGEEARADGFVGEAAGAGSRGDGGEKATSYANMEEASAIAAVAAALVANGVAAADIGVLTPYSAQALQLRRALAAIEGLQPPVRSGSSGRAGQRSGRGVASPESDGRDGSIEVSSVDGFQGREKEVILFSCVRSNDAGGVGFLSDARRLNVALTRARSGLVVVGNDATLRVDPNWRAFLAHVEKRGCVVSCVDDVLAQ